MALWRLAGANRPGGGARAATHTRACRAAGAPHGHGARALFTRDAIPLHADRTPNGVPSLRPNRRMTRHREAPRTRHRADFTRQVELWRLRIANSPADTLERKRGSRAAARGERRVGVTRRHDDKIHI